MRIFQSEHHGNAVKKAKGTPILRKLNVDVLREEVPVSHCRHSSEVSNLNNSLNIIPYNINNHQ